MKILVNHVGKKRIKKMIKLKMGNKRIKKMIKLNIS